jgi:hypothetical protein
MRLFDAPLTAEGYPDVGARYDKEQARGGPTAVKMV